MKFLLTKVRGGGTYESTCQIGMARLRESNSIKIYGATLA